MVDPAQSHTTTCDGNHANVSSYIFNPIVGWGTHEYSRARAGSRTAQISAELEAQPCPANYHRKKVDTIDELQAVAAALGRFENGLLYLPESSTAYTQSGHKGNGLWVCKLSICCRCDQGFKGRSCQFTDATTCNGKGHVDDLGGCKCHDPAIGEGPTCVEYSNSQTCNGLGTVDKHGRCKCNDPATGEGPTCTEFSNAKTCSGAGVVDAVGRCTCHGPATGLGPTCAELSNRISCSSLGVVSVGACDKQNQTHDGIFSALGCLLGSATFCSQPAASLAAVWQAW